MSSFTYADLVFCDLANALISSWASRSEEWLYWEILQFVQMSSLKAKDSPNAQVFIDKSYLDICVQTRHLASPLEISCSWNVSASEVILKMNRTDAESLHFTKTRLLKSEDHSTLSKTRALQCDFNNLALYPLDAELIKPALHSFDELSQALLQSADQAKNICSGLNIKYCNSNGLSGFEQKLLS